MAKKGRGTRDEGGDGGAALAPAVAENPCEHCGGSGEAEDGGPCDLCEGSGVDPRGCPAPDPPGEEMTSAGGPGSDGERGASEAAREAEAPASELAAALEGIERPSFRPLEIELAELEPNGTNRNVKDDPALEGLAESIRQLGVLQPLIVRVIAGEGRPPGPPRYRYKIVAGERRYRAAGKAGLAKVPCLCCETDEAVAEAVKAAENLQRKDLAPLEEAAQVAGLLAKGFTQAQAARILGQTPTWVSRRAVVARLSEKWKRAIVAREAWLAGWSIGHLETIARMPPEKHDEIHGRLKDKYGQAHRRGSVPTEASLREDLLEGTLSLSAAQWKLDDATLEPKAGPCSTCPKRSDAQADLFGDVEAKGGLGVCLDMRCFAAKAKLAAERKLSQLYDEHGDNLVLLRRDWGDERLFALQIPKRYAKCVLAMPYQIDECKAGAKGAKPAIKINTKSVGRTLWVNLGGSASGGGPRTKKPASERTPLEAKAALKERQGQLRQRRQAAFVKRIRELIVDDRLLRGGALNRVGAEPRWWRDPKRELAFALSLLRGFVDAKLVGDVAIHRKVANVKDWALARRLFPSIRKLDPAPALPPEIKQGAEGLLEFALAIAAERLAGVYKRTNDEEFAEAGFLAEMFEFDADAFKAEIAVEMPFPKSWGDVKDEWARKAAAPAAGKGADSGGEEQKALKRALADPEKRAIAVTPERLNELAASNSAGLISEDKGLRTPFVFAGREFICVSSEHVGLKLEACDAYRLFPRAEFKGKIRRYRTETPKQVDAARESELGGYHGLGATANKREVVLVGPPVRFVSRATTATSGRKKAQKAQRKTGRKFLGAKR